VAAAVERPLAEEVHDQVLRFRHSSQTAKARIMWLFRRAEARDHATPPARQGGAMDRRDFLKTAGAGVTAATVMMTPREAALAQRAAEQARLGRIAGCSWPIRGLFKTRAGRGGGAGGAVSPMKQQYGEITMLDFPQFVKDTFPGVTKLDIFSGLFGDVTDDSMYITAAEGGGGGAGFDPTSPSGRAWLDRLAGILVKTGTKVQHVSNNAPFALADFGSPEADARRKAGVAMAKRWLEGCAGLGVTSMRMNSPQALGPSIRPNAIPRSGDGYPRNLEIVPLLDAATESYKALADAGGRLGIAVTFENHWGLAADPMNLRIMVDAVNHPYCSVTPDFCNWEHEHMLVSGLKALAPYATSNVHAKYWDRWGDKNDVQRGVRIMLAGGFTGTFALEYEAGPLNGVEGAKYLYREVLAALTSADAEASRRR
jgi:sugar phosphate isomerase/epimerase